METESVAPRDRILLIAHELFYQKGILSMGINQIIADAKVTKVTFYRHFPSKNKLILAFLTYRHHLWIGWFNTSLESYNSKNRPLADCIGQTIEDWMKEENWRGCAFINSEAELGRTLPEAQDIVIEHKAAMVRTISGYLKSDDDEALMAEQIGMLIDGAIVAVQRGRNVDDVIRLLTLGCRQLLTSSKKYE